MNQNTDTSQIGSVFFENAAEGFAVVDSKGILKLTNPRMDEMFGYEKGELLGKSIDILVPRKSRGNHAQKREQYNNAPQKRSMGIGMDLRGVKKNGEEFPVEISLNHMMIKGEPLVNCLVTDISERKKAELELQKLNIELEKRVEERTLELRQSQQLHNLIARNFPNGTINVFDKDLNYVFVEGAELYRLGFTSEKLIGTNYLTKLDDDVKQSIEKQLLQAFDGKDTSFEINYKKHIYKITAVGLVNLEGKIDRLLVVEENITQQKKSEEQLLLSLEKEKELNELKSRFVSMASHEFRTPLSSILTSVNLLEKYAELHQLPLEEKHLKQYGRVRSAVRHLNSILQDFLSLDRLENETMLAQSELFSIPDACLNICNELQVIAKKGQEIKYSHIGENEMKLDASFLKNSLINLISNAIKYSSENKVIEISTVLSKKTLVLKVKDFGVGIPVEDQHHMFSRFFRAKNVTNIEGTGLGLNIVKKYVDLMGGEITFNSALNEGSEFIVTLPNK